MKHVNRTTITALAICLLCNGCLGPINEDSPRANMELVWDDFAARYCSFEARGVDWDNIYDKYVEASDDITTDGELFTLLSAMLSELDDPHVALQTQGMGEYFSGGYDHWPTDFSLDLVKDVYLQEARSPKGYPTYTYGRLTESIGYIHLALITEENTVPMDSILSWFGDLSAIVLDLRNNGGGSSFQDLVIAGFFTDSRRTAYSQVYRNGPDYNDFSKPAYEKIVPSKKNRHTGRVIVLTNRRTVSAGETTVIAMSALPNVTVVGTRTAGAQSDVLVRRMLNDWRYYITVNLVYSHDGKCYEGVGFEPDIKVANTSSDLLDSRDRVLEAAIELIESGD